MCAQGLIPRVKELAKLGGSLFLAFAPSIIVISVLFTVLYAVRMASPAQPGCRTFVTVLTLEIDCIHWSPLQHDDRAIAASRCTATSLFIRATAECMCQNMWYASLRVPALTIYTMASQPTEVYKADMRASVPQDPYELLGEPTVDPTIPLR